MKRLLESGEPISEKDFLDRDKYPWLEEARRG